MNSSPRLKVLDEKLKSISMFASINVREYLHAQLDRKQIYDLVHNGLHLGGLSVKAVHYSHIPGGQKPALHFVWRVSENSEEVIQNCIRVVRKIEAEIPNYERPIMLKTFQETYGFAPFKVVLRAMFRDSDGLGE